jgi:hypothetical protein
MKFKTITLKVIPFLIFPIMLSTSCQKDEDIPEQVVNNNEEPPSFFDSFDNASNPWKTYNIDYSFTNGTVKISRETHSEKTYGTLNYTDFDNLHFYELETKVAHKQDLTKDDGLGFIFIFNNIPDITQGKQLTFLGWYIFPGSIFDTSRNWYLYFNFYDHETGENSQIFEYGDDGVNKILDELVNLDGVSKNFKVLLDNDFKITLYSDDFKVHESNTIKNMVEENGLLMNRDLDVFSYFIKNNCNLVIDNIYLK